MEFLKQNYINTTTQLTINNNTALAENIFNRDSLFQYYTDGLNNDATTASLTITFDSTTPVSRLALMDTNLKGFTLFYNGATANTFSLSDGNTTASNYSANSASSLYLRCATTMVSSITLDMKTTQVANAEKILGSLIVTDLYFALTQIPDAKGYKPSRVPKQITHTLSDGGIRLQNIRKKFNININLDYLSSTQTSSLKDIFELNAPFYFCPFGTATGSWDAILFEAVWPGSFDFYEFSDNAISSGFSGNIRLKETPS